MRPRAVWNPSPAACQDAGQTPALPAAHSALLSRGAPGAQRGPPPSPAPAPSWSRPPCHAALHGRSMSGTREPQMAAARASPVLGEWCFCPCRGLGWCRRSVGRGGCSLPAGREERWVCPGADKPLAFELGGVPWVPARSSRRLEQGWAVRWGSSHLRGLSSSAPSLSILRRIPAALPLLTREPRQYLGLTPLSSSSKQAPEESRPHGCGPCPKTPRCSSPGLSAAPSGQGTPGASPVPGQSIPAGLGQCWLPREKELGQDGLDCPEFGMHTYRHVRVLSRPRPAGRKGAPARLQTQPHTCPSCQALKTPKNSHSVSRLAECHSHAITRAHPSSARTAPQGWNASGRQTGVLGAGWGFRDNRKPRTAGCAGLTPAAGDFPEEEQGLHPAAKQLGGLPVPLGQCKGWAAPPPFPCLERLTPQTEFSFPWQQPRRCSRLKAWERAGGRGNSPWPKGHHS